MTDQNTQQHSGGATATVERTKPAPPKLDRMPQWKVLLHNDPINEMLYVVETIMELTVLKRQEAVVRMLEAHKTGIALLLTTHREHAELLSDQFATKRLKVTIEPAPS